MDFFENLLKSPSFHPRNTHRRQKKVSCRKQKRYFHSYLGKSICKHGSFSEFAVFCLLWEFPSSNPGGDTSSRTLERKAFWMVSMSGWGQTGPLFSILVPSSSRATCLSRDKSILWIICSDWRWAIGFPSGQCPSRKWIMSSSRINADWFIPSPQI